MAHRLRVSVGVLVAALALVASGCGGEDPDEGPDALPTPSTSDPTSPTATPTDATSSPTADPEAWRAKFSEDQLAEFDRALAVWKQFQDLQDRYQQTPVDRETVQSFYERYTHNAAALSDSYEANFIVGGVRIPSQPTPLTWTGREVQLGRTGSLVEFDQCTDYTTLVIRRNGKPVEGAAPTENASAIVRVRMDSDADGTWRLFSSKVVDKPCA